MASIVPLQSFRPYEYFYEGGILITSSIWMSTRLPVILESTTFCDYTLEHFFLFFRLYNFCSLKTSESPNRKAIVMCCPYSREANWVSSILIRRMAISSITDATSNGVYNWDKVVQRILRNVLLASLSCRVGDIMKDDLDDEEFPFLYHDDIVIKLVNGNCVENLEAIISIRNEKRMG